MDQSGSRPRGREEITKAVIEAATTLFAERGPAGVSLRDVATSANVTLSQIFRHVGNKDQLLEAVLAADVQTTPTTRESSPPDLRTLLRALFQRRDPSVRTKLQARVILDGYDLPALQHRYPGIELAIELLRADLPEDEARFRTAVFTTFFAGWQLLGDSYLQVAGAEGMSDEQVTAMLEPVLQAMATAPSATALSPTN